MYTLGVVIAIVVWMLLLLLEQPLTACSCHAACSSSSTVTTATASMPCTCVHTSTYVLCTQHSLALTHTFRSACACACLVFRLAPCAINAFTNEECQGELGCLSVSLTPCPSLYTSSSFPPFLPLHLLSLSLSPAARQFSSLSLFSHQQLKFCQKLFQDS